MGTDSIYYVSKSDKKSRHFFINTLMASSTSMSAGRMPVDSTETKKENSVHVSNNFLYAYCIIVLSASTLWAASPPNPLFIKVLLDFIPRVQGHLLPWKYIHGDAFIKECFQYMFICSTFQHFSFNMKQSSKQT